MIGLVALDLVLRVVRAGVMDITFVGHFLSVHPHYPAGDPARLGIPAHVIADVERSRHECLLAQWPVIVDEPAISLRLHPQVPERFCPGCMPGKQANKRLSTQSAAGSVKHLSISVETPGRLPPRVWQPSWKVFMRAGRSPNLRWVESR